MNLLDGEVSGKSNCLGGWVDASIAQGRILQSAGLFRIDPNMTWGNQLIANDAQGGYYRFDYQSRQWIADVGIDEVRSVSGLGTNTTFLTGDARYQMSRDWGVGGVANVSRSDGGTGWSLEGLRRSLECLGHGPRAGRLREHADGPATSPLRLEQTWTMPAASASAPSRRWSASAGP